MSFTPGSWIAFPSKGTWAGWLVSPGLGAYTLATCLWQHDENGNAHYDAEANARLIAAAPELLEAAKMLASLELKDGGRTFPTKEMCAVARAAIAKALGDTEHKTDNT